MGVPAETRGGLGCLRDSEVRVPGCESAPTSISPIAGRDRKSARTLHRNR